jgi:hypothetical protein
LDLVLVDSFSVLVATRSIYKDPISLPDNDISRPRAHGRGDRRLTSVVVNLGQGDDALRRHRLA